MSYLHADINPTSWLIGVAFTFEWFQWEDAALFVHLGPICVGIHRDNYFEDWEQK